MTEHEPSCASLQVLLSNPPQYRDCDCSLGRRAQTKPSASPPPGNPGNPFSPNVVSMFKGRQETHVGAEVKPVSQILRDLADQMDAGVVEMPASIIMLHCARQYTSLPYLIGDDMSSAQMLGKVEIGKAMLLDAIMAYVE